MSIEIRYGLKEMERDYGPLTFGQLISSYRLGEEMTQVKLAKILGISKQSLNDLEKGHTFPSLGRAVEISKKLSFYEPTAIRILIQDLFRREKLPFIIRIESAKVKKKPRRAS